MGNRLRTTYYTRKVALVEPASNTIPGTDNLQEYNIVSYTMLGNKRYIKLNDSPWFLDKVMNDEGYTRFELGDEDYPFYYIKDHLGNIRETYVRISGNKFCAQRMQYYPSGLPWDESQGASEQPFKYGSKEFIEMHGLDEYDSQARWYYPAIMRTTTMDPMCERYYSTSPYAWCSNNPVNYIDPDGNIFIAEGDSAQNIVLQTINPDDRQYLSFDENGKLSISKPDLDRMAFSNLIALNQLVNDESNCYIFTISDQFGYLDENGNYAVHIMEPIDHYQFPGETGSFGSDSPDYGMMLGICQTPGCGRNKYASIDDKVHIVLHADLSPRGFPQVFAHEAYGHAYLYSLGLNHLHQFVKGHEGNILLKYYISRAINETIQYQNMKR